MCLRSVSRDVLAKFDLKADEITAEQNKILRQYYSTDLFCISRARMAAIRSDRSC